ncbi:MAG: diadenylate cyclase CdaA [Oscillospiraceae bacterium]|jgi:diadenylate cyclase|nr:diadenylate cyclase CdaA [Oscillospiraceae bacterium]
MLTYLLDIWRGLINIVRTISLSNVFEILIIAFFIYQILRFVRETRAEQLLRGIIIVVAALLLMRQFHLEALTLISETFFNVGLMAVIVMFQPELRRILEKMGRAKMDIGLTSGAYAGDAESRAAFCIDQISRACEKLSRTATGALIVMERQTKLGEQIDTGTVIAARPSVELIGNIFFKNTPLHDGALIVRDGLLHAAGCFLPKPGKEELISKELGSRHRAAIGMSENSDAVVVIVSEETGMISIAENGVLTRAMDRAKLQAYLTNAVMSQSSGRGRLLLPRKRKESGE